MQVLSFELGRAYGLRINTISAGALKSRAASAIGGARGEKTYIEYCIDYQKANAPLTRDLEADDVGATAAFLCSPLAAGITGVNLYVDNGIRAMAASIDSRAFEGFKFNCATIMDGGCNPRAPVLFRSWWTLIVDTRSNPVPQTRSQCRVTPRHRQSSDPAVSSRCRPALATGPREGPPAAARSAWRWPERPRGSRAAPRRKGRCTLSRSPPPRRVTVP